MAIFSSSDRPKGSKRRRRWVVAGGLATVAMVATGLAAGTDNEESATDELSIGVGSAVADTRESTTVEQPATSRPASSTSPSTTDPVTTTSTAATTSTTTTSTSTTSTTIATTIATTSTATTSATTVPDVIDPIRRRLDALTIADPDPARRPYERDDYGGWADTDGDCRSTRHEVLIQRSAVPVTFSADGCRVETGEWVDPFTGALLTTADEATIDHQIPLAEAHRAGGWRWDDDTKARFANDATTGALNVVGGDVNQSKADKRPDQWLPPLEESHCAYAIAWIDAKARWALTATTAEVDALDRLLDSCDPDTIARNESVADDGSFVDAVVVTTLAPAPTTLPPVAVEAGPGVVRLESCDKRTEEVVIANTGGEAANLDGYLLHDEGRKHETPLGQWGPLPGGSRLTIVTGDDATSGYARVVWKTQNVWNNDGDIAHLVDPAGAITTVPC